MKNNRETRFNCRTGAHSVWPSFTTTVVLWLSGRGGIAAGDESGAVRHWQKLSGCCLLLPACFGRLPCGLIICSSLWSSRASSAASAASSKRELK